MCVLWCMWSFSARGANARLSPLAEASRKLNPNPKGRPAPTAKIPHAPAHTLASLPPTFRVRGQLRIPGLHCSAVRVSPSAASWIRSCENQEKLRGTHQVKKTTCRKCLKLHSANLSTWRTPRNSENAAKTAQIQNPRGNRRSPGRTINKSPTEAEAPNKGGRTPPQGKTRGPQRAGRQKEPPQRPPRAATGRDGRRRQATDKTRGPNKETNSSPETSKKVHVRSHQCPGRITA